MVCRLLERLYLFLHRQIFAHRLRNSRCFPEHCIISIGNLSAGGTGKTPVTIDLACAVLSEGKSVLVCLRGYRGRSRSGALAADEKGLYLTPLQAGDEAVLIASRLLEYTEHRPESCFRVVVGSNRAALIDRFGSGMDTVILDDAFQNPSVQRDLDIVLIDTMVPVEALKLLPCGRFREDLDALERAHVVFLTRTNLAPDSARQWKQKILDRYPELSVFSLGIRIAHIPEEAGNKWQQVAAFCGIGNPESFFRVLEDAGFTVVKRFIFRDHHHFSKKDLAMLKGCGLPLVTTEKDAARLGRTSSDLIVHPVRTELFASALDSVDSTDATDIRAKVLFMARARNRSRHGR
jgi:tetraacyldisaccharide 4'-kinase